MQYLDGKLYVLHNPKFSVFDDGGGVGQGPGRPDRVHQPEPLGAGLERPRPGQFPPGDGRLLLRGRRRQGRLRRPSARDGRRVDLHGGGILRLRPDGTGLEVYCTGVRNILDVALDAEDEIFTYDNTDEHHWMSRLTHMVDGGFYGYPYDFVPRRPYTLWMMADYGGGAATGAICYTEDALPPEYHGNLFLADFGKRQVLRVTVARDGATFRARRAAGPVRRRARATSARSASPGRADGLGLYICDWQHADTKEAVDRRPAAEADLHRAAATPPRSRPGIVDAAMGRAVPGDDRGPDPGPVPPGPQRPGRGPAAARRAGRRGRRAAGGPAGRRRGARPRPSACPLGARRHRRRGRRPGCDPRRRARPGRERPPPGDPPARHPPGAGGDRGPPGAGSADADASVRFQAATALGRIGDPQAVPGLVEALDEADLFARYAAFTALNRIGRADPTAWRRPRRRAGAPQGGSSGRASGWPCARPTRSAWWRPWRGSPGTTGRSDGPERRRWACWPGVARRRPAWKGEWWAYHPAIGTPPAETESWAGTEAVLAALREALDDDRPAIRLAGVEGLREAKDRRATGRLRGLFRAEADPEVRRAMLSALGALHDGESGRLVAEVLRQPEAHAGLLPEAIAAAEGVGGEEVAAALEHLLASDRLEPGLLRPTITALGRLRSAAASTPPHPPRPLGGSRDPAGRPGGPGPHRRRAGPVGPRAAGRGPRPRGPAGRRGGPGRPGDRATIPTLLEAYRDPQVRPAALSALVRGPTCGRWTPIWRGSAARTPRSGRAAAGPSPPSGTRPSRRSNRGPIDCSPQVVIQLRQVYEDHALARRGRLFAVELKAPGPEDYLEFARTQPGDAARGRALFHDREGLGCVKCHRVGGEGGEVGAGPRRPRRRLCGT